jgi:hypothetical protein
LLNDKEGRKERRKEGRKEERIDLIKSLEE